MHLVHFLLLYICSLPVFTLHYTAPFFAVADHRDQDPPVALLSFEGRCYLLIQIQIRIVSVNVSMFLFALIGDGRSFKLGGQEWGSGAVPQWGPGAKPCWRFGGFASQQLTTLYTFL